MIADRDTGELKAQLDALRRNVDRLIMLIDGSEDMDIDGMRQRLERQENLGKEVQKFKWILYGIGIGLGVTGLSSIGTLLAVLSKAAGGP
jgi:hypothetical protein